MASSVTYAQREHVQLRRVVSALAHRPPDLTVHKLLPQVSTANTRAERAEVELDAARVAILRESASQHARPSPLKPTGDHMPSWGLLHVSMKARNGHAVGSAIARSDGARTVCLESLAEL